MTAQKQNNKQAPAIQRNTKLILTMFLSLFMGCFLPSKAATPLSGTYTIDPSGSGSANYKSFTLAVSALTSSGISSSVVFKVADGTYNERIKIGAISGVSSGSTITFQSASGDSTKVILTQASSTSSTTNYTLYLNACTNVIFNKISIQRTGTATYGGVIQIDGGSSANEFTHCMLKGEKLSSSGTSDQAIIYSAISEDDSNKFIQNNFKYGAYDFYYLGVYATHENGTLIQDNTMDSAYQYGIYITFQDTLSIIHNTITNVRSSTGNGIYIKYYYNSNIRKNTIYLPSGGTGIYADYAFVFGGTDSTFFANNMITMGGTAGIGMYIYYVQGGFANFYDNSVLLLSTNGTSSTCIWLDHQYQTNVINNIFDNRGKGYSIYINNTGRTIFNENYNALYTNGSYLGYFAGTSVTTLSHWMTTTTYDSNSLNLDAPFISNTNLHLSSGALRNGTVLYTISDDLDGDIRSVLPNIGADEIAPLGLDARITALDTPALTVCTGSQNIVVTLTNVGTTTLTNANITWKVNGGTATTYSWTGSLPFAGSTIVNIGTYTFSKGTMYNLQVYSSSPNGGTDADPTNDTLLKSNFETSLNGTYTIGAGGAYDYATFSDAIAGLDSFGVCGSTIFKVADGSYNEQIEMGIIDGTSLTKSVSFQSASGDSSKVVLTYASTKTKNYVVHLNGASYINFNNITLKSTGSAYGIVAEIEGGSNYNTFSHDRFIGVKTSSDSGYLAIINSANTSVDGNKFIQNLFKYGAYDFYLYASFGKYDVHTLIQDNIMDSANYCAIYAEYQDSITIIHNTISNIKTIGYGIYFYAFGNSNILGNNIIMPKGGDGIYSDYPYLPSKSGDSTFFANNMISMGGSYSTGIYADYGYNQYINIYYNSILMLKTNTAYTYAVNIKSFTPSIPNVRLSDNIFDNEGSGYAVYIAYSTYGVSYSDYNDLFSKGTNLGYYNSTNYSSLSNWQSGTSWDANSISSAAPFTSNTNLHLKKSGGMRKGGALYSIADDLDGDLRSSSPYLGADEIVSTSFDVSVVSIDTPGLSVCSGTQDIVVTFANYGTATVTSAILKWQVNGGTTTSYSWTGSLAFGSKTSVKVGTYTFNKGTTYSLNVSSSSPNGGKDTNTSNDTAYKNNFITSLNGTYTIGGPGHDFKNFTTAIAYMKADGVCGPVIFNVQDSVYKEQIEIDKINGASSIYTITFQSKSGDSSKVRLTSPGGTTNNYTVYLNGATYINFNKISIIRSGTDYYSVVVDVEGGAKHNSFTHCRLIGVNSTSGATSQAIIYSLNTKNDSNSFIGNLFKYGGYDFYWYGTYTAYDAHTVIQDNIMDSAYAYCIYAQYQDSMAIVNNRITNILNSIGYGIYLNYYGNSDILKNTILMPKGGYGIYSGMTTLSRFASDSSFYANNMISMGGTASVGIYAYYGTSQYVNIYYNSILMQTTNGTGSYALQIESYSTSPYVMVYDNILDNRGKGYALYITYKNYGLIASDFNDLYTNGSNLGYIGASAYSNLANWQAGSGFDSNSVSKDAPFVSVKDLHLSSPSLKNGIPLNSVFDDIDGQSRSAFGKTTMGADEVLLSDDIGITGILTPVNNSCGDSNATVKVIVSNFGSNSQNGFTCYFSMNGGSPISETHSNTLPAGASDTLTFTNKANTYIGGLFKLKAYTSLSADMDHNNDTAKNSINVYGFPNDSFSYKILDLTNRIVRFEPKDSSSGLHYNWNFGDGNTDTSNVHPVHTYSTNALFIATLTVKNAGGCISSSKDSINLILTGTESINPNGFNALLYPNPFKDNIHITYTLEKASCVQIQIFDAEGKLMTNLIENQIQTPGNYSYTLDADKYRLKAGLYLIQLRIDKVLVNKTVVRVD